jgi:hypothetical protein
MLEHNLELGEISSEFSQMRQKVLFGVQYRDVLQVVQTHATQLRNYPIRERIELTSLSSLGTSPCKLRTMPSSSNALKTG